MDSLRPSHFVSPLLLARERVARLQDHLSTLRTIGRIGIVSLLWLVSADWAHGVVVLDDGGEHVVADAAWAAEGVEVRGATTVRVVAGGAVGALTGFDAAVVEIAGGEVSGRLYLRGESRCSVAGGVVGDLQVAHGSVAVVDAGTVGRVSARSFAGVWLRGGDYPGGVEVVEANGGGAFLEVTGGDFSGGSGLLVGLGGRLVVRGGSFAGLLLAGGDGASLSGGVFAGPVEVHGGELQVRGGELGGGLVIGGGAAVVAGGVFPGDGVLLGGTAGLVFRGDGAVGEVAGGWEWRGELPGGAADAVVAVTAMGEGGTVRAELDGDLDGAADDGEGAADAGDSGRATTAVAFGYGTFLGPGEPEPVQVVVAEGGVLRSVGPNLSFLEKVLLGVGDGAGEVVGLPPSPQPGRRGVMRLEAEVTPGSEVVLEFNLPDGGETVVRELWEFSAGGNWDLREGEGGSRWRWRDEDGDGRITLVLGLVEGGAIARRGFFRLVKEGAAGAVPELKVEVLEGGGYVVSWPAAGAEGWGLESGDDLDALVPVDPGTVVEEDGMLVVRGGGALVPGPPGEFLMTGPTETVATATPTVRWTAAPGADHYVLHVARNTDCDNIAFSATVTTTSVTVPPLPNRAYVLCLTAINAEGERVASNHKKIVEVAAPYQIEEPHHVVFVSTIGVPASSGAEFDDIVDNLARGAGLNTTGAPWQAIVSTSVLDARDKVRILGPVYNTNGELVAHDATQFWEGILETTMNYDETGTEVTTNSTAWTGMNGGGGLSPNNTCEDWTTNSFFFTGRAGEVRGLSSGGWQSTTSNSCNVTRRLYGISPLFE